MKDWLVPLGLGAAVGLLLWVFPAPGPDAPPHPAEPGETADWNFVFEEGPRMETPHGEVLLVTRGETPATITWPRGAAFLSPTANVSWHGPIGTVAIDQETIYCIRAPCPQPEAPWLTRPPLDERRFDAQNQTVRVTLYAFQADGALVASNAPTFRLDEYQLSDDYIPLSQADWYLGTGTAPNGSATLPFGAGQARNAFDGMPVGAIATLHLVEHPYAWYIGELWLTARIDSFA